jgi:hypothetical protein
LPLHWQAIGSVGVRDQAAWVWIIYPPVKSRQIVFLQSIVRNIYVPG